MITANNQFSGYKMTTNKKQDSFIDKNIIPQFYSYDNDIEYTV